MTSNTTAKQSLRGYIFDKLYSRDLKLSIDALFHLEQELDELEHLDISEELILLDKAIHLARERGGYYNCQLNHAVWAYVLGLTGVNPYEYELTARNEQVDRLCLGVAASPVSSTILEQCMLELGLSSPRETGDNYLHWYFEKLTFCIHINSELTDFEEDLKRNDLGWETLCQIPLEDPSILAQISSHLLKHYYPQITSICATIKPQCLMELCNAYAIAALGDQTEEVLQKYMAYSETETPYGVTTPTRNIVLYREQASVLVRTLAGFSPLEARELRRDFGKKIYGKLDEWKSKFFQKGLERGHPPKILTLVWEQIATPYAYTRCSKSYIFSCALQAYLSTYVRILKTDSVFGSVNIR